MNNQDPIDWRSLALMIALSLGVYLAWSEYMRHKYPDSYNKSPSTATTAQTPPAQPGSGSTGGTPPGATTPGGSIASSPTGTTAPAGVTAAEAQIPRLAGGDLKLSNDAVTYVFQQEGGALKSVILHDHLTNERGAEPRPIDLTPTPFAMQAFVGKGQDWTPNWRLMPASRTGQSLTFVSTTPDGWELQVTYTIAASGFGLDVAAAFKNTANVERTLVGGLGLAEETVSPEQQSSMLLPGAPTQQPRVFLSLDGSSHWEEPKELCKQESDIAQDIKMANVGGVGFDTHYYLKALIPGDRKASLVVRRTGPGSEHRCPTAVALFSDHGSIAAQGTIATKYRLYFGPKEIEALTSFDPVLRDTLDLGWFAFIAYPLLSAIKFLYNYVGNYGIAIIILTAVLKILFYPLTRAAAVSMHRMKKYQPEMQAIRERHKEDPQRQQRELMAFMSANKINPMKGCFPVLPQIPVFFAFYRVLSTAIELRAAPFAAWIQDLSLQDPYYVTPVVLTGAMFLQQRLTPTAGMDKAQERIMMMMPIVFGLLMLTLPSGMVIYMLVNTIISIIQQRWLNAKLSGTVPAQRELKEKRA